MIKHILQALSMSSLLVQSSIAAAQTDPVDQSAFYSGPVSTEQNRIFFEHIAGRDIRRLVITSSGGEVEAGIELGRWVFEKQLDVVVPRHCLSSCANYVFTAGLHKIIQPGAIVAWHGNYHHLLRTGLWRDEVPGRMERYHEDTGQATRYISEQVKHLAQLESEFFRQVGVDEYLCWIGKMPPFNAVNYYFMSVEDMARFGVVNVSASPGYADTDLGRFSDSIIFIQLPKKP